MATDFEEDEFGGVEDGDLLLAAMDAERNSIASPPTTKVEKGLPTLPTSSKPYRLEFGKNRGKTLDEVPKKYIDWIVSEEVYDTYPNLKVALLARGDIIDGEFAPTGVANGNGEMLNKPTNTAKSDMEIASDAKVQTYRLNFGKYEGKPLKEVPVSYIRYLTERKVHEDRSDFYGALTELAYSTDTSGEGTDGEALVRNRHDSVFFDEYTGEEFWITSRDASTFFQVADRHLRNAGIAPLQKGRWNLSDVYVYVQHHRSEHRADLGLKNFLQKNSDREQDIYGDLGLGISLACGDEDSDESEGMVPDDSYHKLFPRAPRRRRKK